MKCQQTFGDIEFAGKKKRTRREIFLGRMERLIPWDEWTARIKEHYPAQQRGRPAKSVSVMLRAHLLRTWYGLSAEATEDAIYDVQSMRAFAGVNLLTEDAPDATTILRFGRLLKRHGLDRRMSAELSAILADNRLILRKGSFSEAALVSAPRRAGVRPKGKKRQRAN